MKQAEAIKTIQEAQSQIDEILLKLQPIGPLATFGDGPAQADFTQAIYDLKSAKLRLGRALEGLNVKQTASK